MTPEPYERVSSIMSTPAITVEAQSTLREVAAVLRDANIGAVVVLAPGRPMAVISERDIVTEEPRYVTPSHPVPRLAEAMLAAGVRHMPVVDENEVVGMVGARDALWSLTDGVLAQRSPEGHRLAIDLERELSYPGG